MRLRGGGALGRGGAYGHSPFTRSSSTFHLDGCMHLGQFKVLIGSVPAHCRPGDVKTKCTEKATKLACAVKATEPAVIQPRAADEPRAYPQTQI